jgi:phosphoribosylformylglycinamidine (FGAM) synthase-like enzyme
VPDSDRRLFSESNSRFLVQVRAACEKRFEKLMRGVACRLIGVTGTDSRLTVEHQGRDVISCPVAELDRAWRTGLTRLL